jgi:catechol 2,3-dioxygenase-like lactoylglutathione lyase family enzyme
MVSSGKPGRKPKRTYVRVARQGAADPDDLPGGRETSRFLETLDRADRLVAHGELTEPRGDMVVFRAREYDEAERVLRSDPWAKVEGASSELFEWAPKTLGSGVNLELPPARGSGRLTLLERVTVVVRDQVRATRFYHEGLGLEVRARDAETGYVELSLGKGTASLSLVAPQREWGEPYYSEAMARLGTRTGIAFQTDSVPALELRLRHLGARVTQAATNEPWGGRTLRFTDPDGNEFLAFDAGTTKGSAARRGA